MNRKDLSIVVIVAVVAGLIGGAVISTLFQTGLVSAQESPKLQKVIMAEEFVVISEPGKGYANLKASPNGVTLYLSYGDGPNATISASPDGVLLYLTNTPLETSSSNIVLTLRKDGEAFLSMNGKRGEEQVYLTTGKDGSPFIRLKDVNGRTRTVLGNTSFVHPQTGVVERRPPSSLVLFNEKGNVIWKAP